jgi:hypothetical protein
VRVTPGAHAAQTPQSLHKAEIPTLRRASSVLPKPNSIYTLGRGAGNEDLFEASPDGIPLWCGVVFTRMANRFKNCGPRGRLHAVCCCESPGVRTESASAVLRTADSNFLLCRPSTVTVTAVSVRSAHPNFTCRQGGLCRCPTARVCLGPEQTFGVLISGDHNKSSESIDVAEGKVKLTFLSRSNIVRGVFRVEQIVVTRAV